MTSFSWGNGWLSTKPSTYASRPISAGCTAQPTTGSISNSGFMGSIVPATDIARRVRAEGTLG